MTKNQNNKLNAFRAYVLQNGHKFVIVPSLKVRMTTSASATDRTVNKVALCSAIFAGAAYVGYSVARQAFGRHLVGHQRNQNQSKSRAFRSISFFTSPIFLSRRPFRRINLPAVIICHTCLSKSGLAVFPRSPTCDQKENSSNSILPLRLRPILLFPSSNEKV